MHDIITDIPLHHTDDLSVDSFASAMKRKMSISRGKGRSGWETCPIADLWDMLREHIIKGDPVDVANLAMMIWHNCVCPHDRPLHQHDNRLGDILAQGPVNSMSEQDSEGSYILLTFTIDSGNIQRMRISHGQAELLNAEIHNILERRETLQHSGPKHNFV
jgi:hypothetical protein